ncbi:MAG: potassium transporter TrkG [Bryobacterales bacterium]
MFSFFGALPFAFSGEFPSFTDAFFESVSGFTTTGPRSWPTSKCSRLRCSSGAASRTGSAAWASLWAWPFCLWSATAAWCSIAPSSPAKSEKLKPRITETASALWRIYFAMTALQYALLRWAGMNNFDALCHTFSTLGTGGFSTRTASVAAFNSPLIEYIIIIFMLLAGISFIQHYIFFIQLQPGRGPA